MSVKIRLDSQEYYEAPWQHTTKQFTINADPCPPMGDVDGDGLFCENDAAILTECILSQTCDNLFYTCAADWNLDGAFNVLETVQLSNWFNENPEPSECPQGFGGWGG